MPYNFVFSTHRWLWKSENRWLAIASIVWFSCVTGGVLFYALFGHRLIESIYEGTSLEFLNELIAHHRASRPWATLEYYDDVGRLIVSRIIVILIGLELMMVAGVKYRALLRIVKEFFSAVTHPINLAVFRIVLFYYVYSLVDVSTIFAFSKIPAELRVAPFGMGWLLDFLPINPTWAQSSAELLVICSFTAMIGLFSRTSALVVAISGFYAWGIPQFYGKVNHYHHLLWFALILAASRCGDALSCDAIIASIERADKGMTDGSGPSQQYSLPLRFVMLLLGIMYFFPGFWKLWTSGVAWAWSDNLKFTMYAKWIELGDWTPFFRVDQYPLLYKLGATMAIIFETSFIFLVFSRGFRLLAPLGGLMFHTMTAVFMGISFNSLLICYVVFFDWHSISSWVGRQLFKDTMYVIFDGNCKLCRRTVAALRVFDILGRVNYLNALDTNAIKNHGLSWLDNTGLMTDMHAIVGTTRHVGYRAYRALAWRVPLLWPIAPLLYLWPLPRLGKWVYRHVADSRTCIIAELPLSIRQEVQGQDELRSVVLKMIGMVLLVTTVIAGAFQIELGWPIACYPTFAWIAGPTIEFLKLDAVRANGEIIAFNEREPISGLSSERFMGLINQILHARSEADQRVRMRALWKLFLQNNPRLKQTNTVRFYQVTLLTAPESRHENPLARKLLLEWKP